MSIRNSLKQYRLLTTVMEKKAAQTEKDHNYLYLFNNARTVDDKIKRICPWHGEYEQTIALLKHTAAGCGKCHGVTKNDDERAADFAKQFGKGWTCKFADNDAKRS